MNYNSIITHCIIIIQTWIFFMVATLEKCILPKFCKDNIIINKLHVSCYHNTYINKFELAQLAQKRMLSNILNTCTMNFHCTVMV